MTRTHYIMLASAGSLALLLGAFAFQHIGGLAPCKLCLWQRWPHAAAIGIGAIGLAGIGGLLIPVAGALAALSTAAIGGYHTGVERGWWEGPASCSGAENALTGLSGNDLLNFDAPVSVVMCDEVVWSLLGLSMASWNMLVALGLAALWFAAARVSSR